MDILNDKYNSINSSITTITITSSSQQQQQNSTKITKTQSITTLNNHQEDDSGIEQDSSILIRVCINEQNLQVELLKRKTKTKTFKNYFSFKKVFKFNLDETVWLAKHRVLTNLARVSELEIKVYDIFNLKNYLGIERWY
jgi:hypothetical protein